MTSSLSRRSSLCLALAAAVAILACARAGGAWAHGDEPDEPATKPQEFKEGLKAIKAGDYKSGIEWMTKALKVTPADADVYNYLGFAHRKLGQYSEALTLYGRALQIDPKHRGAREYLGEAYLALNRLGDAKKLLAELDSLCFMPCEEYQELKEAVEKYEQGKRN